MIRCVSGHPPGKDALSRCDRVASCCLEIVTHVRRIACSGDDAGDAGVAEYELQVQLRGPWAARLSRSLGSMLTEAMIALGDLTAAAPMSPG
jgi:hypothetical protein